MGHRRIDVLCIHCIAHTFFVGIENIETMQVAAQVHVFLHMLHQGIEVLVIFAVNMLAFTESPVILIIKIEAVHQFTDPVQSVLLCLDHFL